MRSTSVAVEYGSPLRQAKTPRRGCARVFRPPGPGVALRSAWASDLRHSSWRLGPVAAWICMTFRAPRLAAWVTMSDHLDSRCAGGDDWASVASVWGNSCAPRSSHRCSPSRGPQPAVSDKEGGGGLTHCRSGLVASPESERCARCRPSGVPIRYGWVPVAGRSPFATSPGGGATCSASVTTAAFKGASSSWTT